MYERCKAFAFPSLKSVFLSQENIKFLIAAVADKTNQ